NTAPFSGYQKSSRNKSPRHPSAKYFEVKPLQRNQNLDCYPLSECPFTNKFHLMRSLSGSPLFFTRIYISMQRIFHFSLLLFVTLTCSLTSLDAQQLEEETSLDALSSYAKEL